MRQEILYNISKLFSRGYLTKYDKFLQSERVGVTTKSWRSGNPRCPFPSHPLSFIAL